jgi:8-oxo-dGTP pyrophosphatase MutT (NUDIX family)
MLVRDDPFEVLMVKRNDRGAFASAFVFPGGVVEQDDYVEPSLFPPDVSAGVGAGAGVTVEERALRMAACRETWEEVAIRLDPSDLVLFSHWITPTFAAKRFDTRFFICRSLAAAAGQCDGTETVALEWIRPREALESESRGERSFLLPTLENLKLLARSENCDEALEAARLRTIVPITPRRVVDGDKVTLTFGP